MDEVQSTIQALKDMQVAAPEDAKAVALQTFDAIIEQEEATEASMDEIQRANQALKDLAVSAPMKARALALQTFEVTMKKEEALTKRMDEVQRAIQAIKDMQVAAPEKAEQVALRTFEAIKKREELAVTKRMLEDDHQLMEAIRASLQKHNVVAKEDIREIAMATWEAIREQEENQLEELPTKEKPVHHTPEMFLERFYYNHESHQLTEDLWFAASWSLKKFFLAHKVLLSSRKSYDVFLNWLVNKRIDREGWTLLRAWEKAQLVYSYASDRFDGGHQFINEWRAEIAEFVACLAQMNIDEGDLAVMINQLKKNTSETGKVVVVDVPETPFKFCGVLFHYAFKCE